jgi:hypothetical protein
MPSGDGRDICPHRQGLSDISYYEGGVVGNYYAVEDI